jgi:hypothetical protein
MHHSKHFFPHYSAQLLCDPKTPKGLSHGVLCLSEKNTINFHRAITCELHALQKDKNT